jgi:imidazole glycerol-phosphate synthase subunit HisF
MVGTRLIIVLTINEGVLYRSRNFTPDYRYTLNFVDGWSVDEVIVLDITRRRTNQTRAAFLEVVKRLTRSFFVPICAGGGIQSIDDCFRLLDQGADKIVVNTAVIEDPQLLSNVTRVMGSQSVVVSIDAREAGLGSYEVMKGCGQIATGLSPEEWAVKAVSLGAGEIFINCIDRDGMLEGYDNKLNSLIASRIDVPVLIAGGAGKWQHLVDGVRLGGASGVCTTNIFHFTEASIRSAKKFMANNGLKVRL